MAVAAFLGQSVKEVRPPTTRAEKRLVGRTSRPAPLHPRVDAPAAEDPSRRSEWDAGLRDRAQAVVYAMKHDCRRGSAPGAAADVEDGAQALAELRAAAARGKPTTMMRARASTPRRSGACSGSTAQVLQTWWPRSSRCISSGLRLAWRRCARRSIKGTRGRACAQSARERLHHWSARDRVAVRAVGTTGASQQRCRRCRAGGRRRRRPPACADATREDEPRLQRKSVNARVVAVR